jgi:hypothetical protein
MTTTDLFIHWSWIATGILAGGLLTFIFGWIIVHLLKETTRTLHRPYKKGYKL